MFEGKGMEKYPLASGERLLAKSVQERANES